MKRIDVNQNINLGSFNKRFSRGLEELGNDGHLTLWCESFDDWYKKIFLTDSKNSKVVAEVSLSLHRKKCWEVEMCSVDSNYQGFGICPHLYLWIMKSLDISIKAGYQQSPGGRGIWYDLAALPEVSVLVRRRGKEFTLAERDDEVREVCSDQFDCYEYETSEVIAVLN